MHPAVDIIVAEQKHPFVFVTISGAHLYGFPSPDSDYDIRGVHVLPLNNVIGLDVNDETIEKSGIHHGIEVDLVTHDVKKFMGLMLRKNGYVLEQLFSPLVARTSNEHEELKALGTTCITKFHAYHYLGFAETQWRLFHKESPRRVKPLLYVYRVLLTGIHLMQTGMVEANLLNLNEKFRLNFIPELVSRKLSGKEKSTLPDADIDFHEREYLRLRQLLEEESARSSLPETTRARAALDDLLKRIRLGT
jgi:predicted nucleotidyltransferase